MPRTTDEGRSAHSGVGEPARAPMDSSRPRRRRRVEREPSRGRRLPPGLRPGDVDDRRPGGGRSRRWDRFSHVAEVEPAHPQVRHRAPGGGGPARRVSGVRGGGDEPLAIVATPRGCQRVQAGASSCLALRGVGGGCGGRDSVGRVTRRLVLATRDQDGRGGDRHQDDPRAAGEQPATASRGTIGSGFRRELRRRVRAQAHPVMVSSQPAWLSRPGAPRRRASGSSARPRRSSSGSARARSCRCRCTCRRG